MIKLTFIYKEKNTQGRKRKTAKTYLVKLHTQRKGQTCISIIISLMSNLHSSSYYCTFFKLQNPCNGLKLRKFFFKELVDLTRIKVENVDESSWPLSDESVSFSLSFPISFFSG